MNETDQDKFSTACVEAYRLMEDVWRNAEALTDLWFKHIEQYFESNQESVGYRLESGVSDRGAWDSSEVVCRAWLTGYSLVKRGPGRRNPSGYIQLEIVLAPSGDEHDPEQFRPYAAVLLGYGPGSNCVPYDSVGYVDWTAEPPLMQGWPDPMTPIDNGPGWFAEDYDDEEDCSYIYACWKTDLTAVESVEDVEERLVKPPIKKLEELTRHDNGINSDQSGHATLTDA